MTELLLDVPDAFPWIRFLPESDVHAFAVELVDTMRAADSLSNNASVALTTDHAEDYGPAPDPESVQ